MELSFFYFGHLIIQLTINPLRKRKQIAHPAQADLISAEDFTIKADLPTRQGGIN